MKLFFKCLNADAHKPQLPRHLAASGAMNSMLPLAPIIDDTLGPRDPINLANAEAASGAVRVAAAEAAGSELGLAGFCPVSLVKRAGLLMPVDPSLGFVR